MKRVVAAFSVIAIAAVVISRLRRPATVTANDALLDVLDYWLNGSAEDGLTPDPYLASLREE